MTATDLLRDLKARDVVLTANGDRLRVNAPRGELVADDWERLRRHKLDLLAALAPAPPAPEPELSPEDLPADWRELYEERAAIREYCGGQCREYAEAEALKEVVAMMRQQRVQNDPS